MPITVIINPSYKWQGNAKSTKITNRELEVLTAIASGYEYKEIATMLDIKYQSVKNHLYHISKKLGVGNNTQALLKALELGMVSLDIRPDDWPFDEQGKRIAPDPVWAQKLREEK